MKPEHVSAGKNGGIRPIWCEFRKWYRAGGDCEGETSESENENDTTLPTAEDQIAMPVDDASSAVVAENKADIAAAKFNSDDDYLQKEISEVYNAILGAQDNIELGIVPPLDAVKIPIDKFKAIMEIVGLDYEDVGDYPPHQHYMGVRIRTLQGTIHETVAFSKYVAAGKNSGPPCWAEFIDYDAVVVAENLADNTNQELYVEQLTLPA
ncbi:hypothetical protein MKW98_028839 [Papaver atlanticum]|uniref:Uncharacterized protein n=1 Tax=Papaver atlanticum TaxID=357466 RepID=A0AAD4S2M9_9MAGN|nr:hypothetical protein MKW98_028839 [Papaver atlanticum]